MERNPPLQAMSCYFINSIPNPQGLCSYEAKHTSDGSGDDVEDWEMALYQEDDGQDLEAPDDEYLEDPNKIAPPVALSENNVHSTNTGTSGSDYETVFTNSKAGMDGVDKEYVKRIVYEMSKSSDFFKNEQRKEAVHRSNNEHLAARVSALTPAELSSAEAAADRFMLRAEAGRDLSRRFIHVDMDMFFAAVEQLRRPQLAELPMAVGGLGMISTANYVARKYGVRSAMPGFIGKVS